MPLWVESLEGKTLLSTGSAIQHVAPHMTAAPIVAQAAAFSGTLSGPYSNVDVPGFSHILSYDASGTLSGVGSTRLRGTLIVPGGSRSGRLLGQFLMRNNGGSMTLNVFQSATPGNDTYKVARARGSDTTFIGGSGNLMITQTSTFSVPYYVSGQVTMTFTSG
jgi:hypothetical protein